MAITTTNVITGVATMFTAPANTPMPADDINIGTDWGTPWVAAGATEEGVTLAVGTNTQDITIEEQATPVAVLITSRNVRVQFAMSEDTVANMKLAYGAGTVTTSAPTTAAPGKSTLVLSDTFDRLAVGFEAVNPFGFYRRVYIPVVVSVADVSTAYRRAANNRAYNVELRAICPSNQITIVDKTAVHT